MAQIRSIDLVVPTIGRTAELERLLGSVAAQTWRGQLRVIVVDQNADERLDPLVDSFRNRIALLHVRSDVGVSRACNEGFRHIAADMVARPDDDCWYPPDVLQRVVDALDEHPEWGALSGVTCDEAGRLTQLRWDRERGVVTPRSVFRRTIGVTLFMRRAVFEAAGGWDESYGPRPMRDGTIGGGSEDGEYALRILAAGFAIGYDPGVRVYHADFTPSFDDRYSMRKAYLYGLDHGRLLRQYEFPAWFVGWRIAQLVAATCFFLARREPGRARFYAAMARGRIRALSPRVRV